MPRFNLDIPTLGEIEAAATPFAPILRVPENTRARETTRKHERAELKRKRDERKERELAKRWTKITDAKAARHGCRCMATFHAPGCPGVYQCGHHIRAKGPNGRIDTDANCLPVSNVCHLGPGSIHGEPERSYACGDMIRSTDGGEHV